MPMSIIADRGNGLGGASSLQGRHMVKCALHKGMKDFEWGRVYYELVTQGSGQ